MLGQAWGGGGGCKAVEAYSKKFNSAKYSVLKYTEASAVQIYK